MIQVWQSLWLNQIVDPIYESLVTQKTKKLVLYFFNFQNFNLVTKDLLLIEFSLIFILEYLIICLLRYTLINEIMCYFLSFLTEEAQIKNPFPHQTTTNTYNFRNNNNLRIIKSSNLETKYV